MMKKILKGCVAGVAVAISTGIQADEPIATLSGITGTVLMNREGEYRSVQPGSTAVLRAGDRVLTLNGSSADIVYADACVVHLPANGTLTLGSPDECTQGIARVENARSFESGGGAAADTPDDAAGINWGNVALFTAAAATTLYVASEFLEDDEPVSPE